MVSLVLLYSYFFFGGRGGFFGVNVNSDTFVFKK